MFAFDTGKKVSAGTEFTKEGFLKAYDALENGDEAANQYIVELEKSDKAWEIGFRLLEPSNTPTQILQGAQLLARKARSSIPLFLSRLPETKIQLQCLPAIKLTDEEQSMLRVMGQLLNQCRRLAPTHKPALKQLASAYSKILVSSKKLVSLWVLSQLPQMAQAIPEIVLQIIESLAESMISYSLEYIPEERQALFEVWKSYLVILRQQHSQLVIECLQMILEWPQAKILSDINLTRIITHASFEVSWRPLAEALNKMSTKSNQVPSQVVDQLASYFQKHSKQHSEDQQYRSAFIDFARLYLNHSAETKNTNQGFLKQVLHSVLVFIGEDKQQIVDSFEFWMDFVKISQEKAQVPSISVMIEALKHLEKVVVQKSILKKLIQRPVPADNQLGLALDSNHIDLGDDDDFEQALALTTGKGEDQSCLTFREYSESFLSLIYKTFQAHPQYKGLDFHFSLLHQLLYTQRQDRNSREVALQLVLFVAKSTVIFMKPDEYQFVSPVYEVFFQNADQICDDLLISFLSLLTESEQLILSSQKMFELTFGFFLKTLTRPALSILASQALSSLLMQLVETLPATQNSLLQTFISVVYQQFTKFEDESVLDNLTTALISLIAKSPDPPKIYGDFLQKFYEKISGLPIEDKELLMAKQLNYLKLIYFAHNMSTSLNSELSIVLAKFTRDVVRPVLLLVINQYWSNKQIKLLIKQILCSYSKACGHHDAPTQIHFGTVLSNRLLQSQLEDVSGFSYLVQLFQNAEQSEHTAAHANFVKQVWLGQLCTAIIQRQISRSQVVKYFAEINKKLISRGLIASDYLKQIAVYSCKVLSTMDFSFEAVRQVLRMFNGLVEKCPATDYALLVAEALLRNYPRIADALSKNVHQILIICARLISKDQLAHILAQTNSQAITQTLYDALKAQDLVKIHNLLLSIC